MTTQSDMAFLAAGSYWDVRSPDNTTPITESNDAPSAGVLRMSTFISSNRGMRIAGSFCRLRVTSNKAGSLSEESLSLEQISRYEFSSKLSSSYKGKLLSSLTRFDKDTENGFQSEAALQNRGSPTYLFNSSL